MLGARSRLIWIIACGWFFAVRGFSVPVPQSNQAEIEKYSMEAKSAMAAKQLPAAAAALEKLSRLTPNVAQVQANLGLVYYMQDRYPEAVVAFRKAQKIDSGLPDVNSMLGICLAGIGHYQDAVKMLGPAFRTSANNRMGRVIGLDLLRAWRALRDYPQANEVAAELLRRYPDDPEVLYNSSRFYGEQSLNLVFRLMKAAPDSPWVPLLFAEINADQKHYGAAITQYRQALKMDADLPGVHLDLGRALLLSSNTPQVAEEALQEFKSELEIDPRNSNAEYEIGEIYRKRAQPSEALQHFVRATELQPGFVEAQIAVARTLINLHRPKEAIPHLLSAIRMRPADEVSHFLLAKAYDQTGNPAGQEKEMTLFRKYHLRPYSSDTHGEFQVPAGLISPEVTPQTLGPTPQEQR